MRDASELFSSNVSAAVATALRAANVSFPVNPVLKTGYWGEPTATVDWCEINYQYSPYIAEFWNTVSNLLFVILGIYGYIRSVREGFERRFRFLFISTAVIGFGSAMFHGTLQMVHQQFDETPMIWGTLVWLYCAYSKEIHESFIPEVLVIGSLTAFGVGFAILHAMNHYVIAFQLVFILLALLCAIRIGLHYRSVTDSHARAVGKSSMLALVLGACLWLLDYNFCSEISSLPINPQGHAWWHLLMGLCTYNAPLLMQYVRAEELKKNAKIVNSPVIGLKTIVMHDPDQEQVSVVVDRPPAAF